MAYKRFDDPNPKVDQSGRKVYAIPSEVVRLALQSISNRVIGGSNGTQGPLIVAGCGDGGTGGCKIANALTVVINGVQNSVIAQDNLRMPAGTQEKNTVAKYLISTGTGTSGTVTGPGNVVSKADYTTIAPAEAAAKLPDLPDSHCALGYLTLNAPTLLDVVMNAAAFGGTQGTSAYTDLVCMPYDA